MLCLAHLARWMHQSHCAAEELDEAAVGRFLNEHFPRCDCPQPVCRDRRDLSTTCADLLRVLHDRDVIAKPTAKIGPVDEELNSFDAYMIRVRGLAEGTRRNRVRIVQRLLMAHFSDQPVAISTLQPADVREFLAAELERGDSASHASALVSALRAYFGYRTACGDQVATLLGVIASPAHWSLASLPGSLTDEEIERLLASFPPGLPSPRRGYAMVRCALDLGLRVGEIAKLALADIDWQAGTLRLRRTKSRREDLLPLPPTAGQAIAAYLRFERPTSTILAAGACEASDAFLGMAVAAEVQVQAQAPVVHRGDHVHQVWIAVGRRVLGAGLGVGGPEGTVGGRLELAEVVEGERRARGG